MIKLNLNYQCPDQEQEPEGGEIIRPTKPPRTGDED